MSQTDQPPPITADPVPITNRTSTTPPKEPAISSAAPSSSAMSVTTTSTGTTDPSGAPQTTTTATLSRPRRIEIPLLIFAVIDLIGIFVLLGFNISVPTTLYAVLTATLLGAGVAIVP